MLVLDFDGAEGAALGNITKSCSGTDLEQQQSGALAPAKSGVSTWKLLDRARALLPQGHRTKRCMYSGNFAASRTGANGSNSGCAVVSVQPDGRLAVQGVMRCGSIWACPRCSRTVSVRRGADLARGIDTLDSSVGVVPHMAHVVVTCRHAKHESLDCVLDRLKCTWSRMRRGRLGARFNETFDLIGTVRGLEVRYGANGWHPHLHVLVLYSAGSIDELRMSLKALYGLAGVDVSVEHGIRVDQVYASKIGEYISKFSASLGHEVGGSTLKAGRSLSSWDLLSKAIDQDGCIDEVSETLWLEYVRTMHGARQLYYSPGLKKLMGLDKDASDDELAQEDLEIVEPVYSRSVLLGAYQHMCREFGRIWLSERAAAFDFKSIDDALDDSERVWDRWRGVNRRTNLYRAGKLHKKIIKSGRRALILKGVKFV